MRNNRENGFTLVELLAVIVILAIILVIAVPKVMSIIEDAKMGTLESTAKMIASAAEKNKVQNAVLGNIQEITCESIAKLNDLDYASCSITFEGNIAKVTMKGSGKFEGLYVCGGTKSNTIVQKEGCGLRKLTINLDGGTDDVEYSLKYETGTSVTLATPTKEGYLFKEWSVVGGTDAIINGNELTMGKTDTEIKALWVNAAVKFEDDDWATIVTAVRSGNYPYVVGNEKTIELGGGLGTHTIRVANTTPCDGSLASESACGFVLEFSDIIKTQQMGNTNVGGWPATTIRTYLNSTVYNAIPEDLRKNIIDTYVISSHGREDEGSLNNGNFDSVDKLYLLSPEEVFGESFTDAYDSSIGTSRQLDYYENKEVTTSNYDYAIKLMGNSQKQWWLRSADSRYGNHFFHISISMSYNRQTCGNSLSISPAFRIG